MRTAGVSLASLAKMKDPLQHRELIEVLKAQSSEGRYVEWKEHLPLGASATKKNKYRTVKAAVSFANTDGGFIIVGVTSAGQWIGLEQLDSSAADQAKFEELINRWCAPPLVVDSKLIVAKGRNFIVLHVPASDFAPHVITEEVKDTATGAERLLAKGAVYCRRGSKCDLAGAHDYHRLFERRLETLRSEMLQRVREVSVVKPGSRRASNGEMILPEVRLTSDADAPGVRLTGNASDARVQIALSTFTPELLEDPNNILALNAEASQGKFSLGPAYYYRIYAGRHRVDFEKYPATTLVTAAMCDLINAVPLYFWFTRISDQDVAKILSELIINEPGNAMHKLKDALLTIGADVCERASIKWDPIHSRESQPPNWYFSFRSAYTHLKTCAPKPSVADPQRAATLEDIVTVKCMSAANGDRGEREPVRSCDRELYGPLLRSRCTGVASELTKLL